MKQDHCEIAYFVDWRSKRPITTSADRIYFGHETCQYLLPSPQKARDLVNYYQGQGKEITLVTPFLTEKGLSNTSRLIDGLITRHDRLEIVCSDIGLLHYLSRNRIGVPVIGRLLTKQRTDPRLNRMLSDSYIEQSFGKVRHMDGTLCELKFQPPSNEFIRLIQNVPLARSKILQHFTSKGIHRCEISNTPQGIILNEVSTVSFSLHVSDIPLAVIRQCPGKGEDYEKRSTCPKCTPAPIPYICPTFPTKVYRRENGLFYLNTQLPDNLNDLPIDRIIYRS